MMILYSTRTDFSYSRSLALAKSKSLNLPSSTRTGDPIASNSPRPNRTARHKRTASGAVAGIAVGGVLILVLIIGGWALWRRRRRAKSTTSKNASASQGQTGREDEKILSDNTTSGARQETSGDSHAQQLEPSHSNRGETHGLGTDDVPGVLPYAAVGGTNGDEIAGLPTTATARDDTTSHLSPHVEAQRKREVEWLKMEGGENMEKRRDASDVREWEG